MKSFKTILRNLVIALLIMFGGVYSYAVIINDFGDFQLSYGSNTATRITIEISGTQNVITSTQGIGQTMLRNGFEIKGGNSAIFDGAGFYGFEFVNYYIAYPDAQTMVFNGIAFINFVKKDDLSSEDSIEKFKGAVIYNVGVSSVEFTGRTIFSGNKVVGDGSSIAQGGAIYNTGRLDFYNSTEISFINNIATMTAGFEAQGGAIYTTGTSGVFFTGSRVNFSGNQAQKGGAIYANAALVTFTNSDAYFINNIAAVSGGAIYAVKSTITFNAFNGNKIIFSGNKLEDDTYSDIHIEDSVLIFNVEAGGDITLHGGLYSETGNEIYKLGDGVLTLRGINYFEYNAFHFEDGTINVKNASFTYLNAAGFTDTNDINFEKVDLEVMGANSVNGGFLYAKSGRKYEFLNIQILESNATNNGGAIFTDGALVTFKGLVQFSGNKALGGGVIYSKEGSTITFNSSTVSFLKNTADTANGGAIALNDNSKMEFKFSEINFSTNTAGVSGGAVYVSGSTVSFDNAKVNFTSNTAIADNGGAIYADGSYISFNVATINFTSNTAQIGGAIYTTDANIVFSRAIVNFIDNFGGAINAQSSSKVDFYGSTISFINNALEKAVISNGSTINFGNSKIDFIKNISGAFFADLLSDINFTNSEIRFLSNEGTAFSINAALVSFNNSKVTFSGNQGGAIEVVATSTISFDGSLGSASFVDFANNTADFGGAINVSNSNISFNGFEFNFTNNTATIENGGAVYINASTVTFNGKGTFFGNTANSGLGGAIYAEASSVTIISSNGDIVFSGNRASNVSNGLNDTYISNAILNLQANNGNINFYGGIYALDASTISISGPKGVFLSGRNLFDTTIFHISSASLSAKDARFTFINSIEGLNSYSSTITFVGSTIAFSTNTGINGGAIAANFSSATFLNSRIDFTSNIVTDLGGVIYANKSNISFINSRINFTTNVAQTNGGSVYAENNSYIVFDRSFVNFTSNTATNGGAIYSNGSIVLFSVSTINFTDNYTATAKGGSIYAENNSYIGFDKSFINFTSNTATNGGAIYSNTSSVTFNGSTVSFGYNSEAIFAEQSSLITFSNLSVRFVGNDSAINASDETRVMFKDLQASFISNILGTIIINTISTVTFNNAKVDFTSNSAANGGAIASNNSSVILNVSTVNFTSNTVSGQGGAIYADNNSYVNLSNSIINFTSNTATSEGGAIFADGSDIKTNNSNVNFVRNMSETDSGGAMFLTQGSTVEFNSSLVNFTSNVANLGGGAISADNSKIMLNLSTANFSGNRAEINNGGAIYLNSSTISFSKSMVSFTTNTTFDAGGAIYAVNSDIIFSGGSTVNFTSNSAQTGSGGAINANSTVNISFTRSNANFTNNFAHGQGGAISVDGDAGFDNVSFSNLLVRFTHNISNNNGGAIGGSSYALKVDAATASFIENTAISSGGVIYASVSTLSFTNSVVNFTSNIASSGRGGVINANNNVDMIFSNNFVVNFTSNSAATLGGAINAENSKISITNSRVNFINNVSRGDGATLGGGAISLSATSMVSSNSTVNFIGNKAIENVGGAILAGNNVDIIFSSSVVNFTSNVALSSGGAIYTISQRILKFDASTVSFIGNTAKFAGAIFAYDTLVSFTGPKVEFIGNKSFSGNGIIQLENNSTIDFRGAKVVSAVANEALEGGFLYLIGQNVTFDGNVNIESNKANAGIGFSIDPKKMGQGGALYLNGAKITFSGNETTIKGNRAEGDGGAIYVDKDSIIDFSQTHLLAQSNISAQGDGGFLYIENNQRLTQFLSPMIIKGNEARLSGGAFHIVNTTVVFSLTSANETKRMHFSGNTAQRYGGAINISTGGYVAINASGTSEILFERNKALEGGAIYITGGDEAHVSTLTISAVSTAQVVFAENIRTNENTPKPNDISMGQNSRVMFNTDIYSSIILNGGITAYSKNNQYNGNIVTKTGLGETVVRGIVDFKKGIVFVEEGTLRVESEKAEIGYLQIAKGATYSTVDTQRSVDGPGFAKHLVDVSTLTILGTLEVGVDGQNQISDRVEASSNIYISNDSVLSIWMSNAYGGYGAADGISIVIEKGAGFTIDTNQPDPLKKIFGKILVNGQELGQDTRYQQVRTYISEDGKIVKLDVVNAMALPNVGGLNSSQQQTVNALNKVTDGNKWNSINNVLRPLLFNAANGNFDYAKKALNELNGTFIVNALKQATLSSNREGLYQRLEIEIEEYGNKLEETVFDEVWVQTNLNGNRYKEDGDPTDEFKVEGYGVQGGINLYAGNEIVAGLFVGYNSNQLRQNYNKADMKDIEIGLYGGWFGEKFNVKGSLSGGEQRYNITRDIRYPAEFDKTGSAVRPTSDFDTQAIRIGAEAEYIAYRGRQINIKPFIGLESGYLMNSEIKESNGENIELTIGSGDYIRLDSKFGLKIEDNFGDMKWHLRGYGGYLIVGNEAGYSVRYSKLEQAGKMDIWGTQEAALTMGFGAGMRYALTPELSFVSNADVNFGKEKVGYNVGFGLSYKVGYGKKLRDRKILVIKKNDWSRQVGKILSDRKIRWVLEEKGMMPREGIVDDRLIRRELGIEVGSEIYVVNGGKRIFYFERRIEAERFVQAIRQAGGDISAGAIKRVVIEDELLYPEGSSELGDIREGVIINRYSNGIKEVSGLAKAMEKAAIKRTPQQIRQEREAAIKAREREIIEETLGSERIGVKSPLTVGSQETNNAMTWNDIKQPEVRAEQVNQNAANVSNQNQSIAVGDNSADSFVNTEIKIEYSPTGAIAVTQVGAAVEVVEGGVELQSNTASEVAGPVVGVQAIEPIVQQSTVEVRAANINNFEEEPKIWVLMVDSGKIVLGENLSQELGIKPFDKVYFVKYAGREYMFGSVIKAEDFIARMKGEGAQLGQGAIEVGIVEEGLQIVSTEITGIGTIERDVVVIRYKKDEIEIMTRSEKQRRDESVVPVANY